MADVQQVNLAELEDVAPRFGVEGVEFRGAREALGCERSGLSLQRIAPGARQPFGHRHAEEEEIYVVLSGGGRIRLDDGEREVRPMDAIRVAPRVARAFEAGPDGLELIAFGSPGGGRRDSEILPGWWGG